MKISKSIERSINILEAISESQGGLTLGGDSRDVFNT